MLEEHTKEEPFHEDGELECVCEENDLKKTVFEELTVVYRCLVAIQLRFSRSLVAHKGREHILTIMIRKLFTRKLVVL